jgi:hypothetical protein
MNERTEIIELMDELFHAVDTKDWETVASLFDSEEKVVVDITSFKGGEPAILSVDVFVDSWQQLLHPKKKTFHLSGGYRVSTDGDRGTVAAKMYAYNVLDQNIGGGMWEVWGVAEIPVHRAVAGWRATGLSFFAWHGRGEDYVRRHTL